jgi:rare lipoprotein A (peptidoglycan hydrolase)
MHKFGDFARKRKRWRDRIIGGMLSLVVVAAGLNPSPAQAYGEWYYGQASYYALHGNTTAYGDVLTWEDWTVASRTLPPGTKLTICYQVCAHGVTVTDYGPAVWTGRVLDMNQIVSDKIGLTYAGHGEVRYRINQGYDPYYANK